MIDVAKTIDPNEIAAEMESRGLDWADKDAAASALEESRKSVLAQQIAIYRPSVKSFAEAEAAALANPLYREHITKMVEARRVANRARVLFDVYKVRAEMLRTNAATDRALMQIR